MNIEIKYQRRKKCKDGCLRNFVIFESNGVEILKIKDPFELKWDLGYDLHTFISNVRFENNRIFLTKTKFGKSRNVSYPISKKKLELIQNEH